MHASRRMAASPCLASILRDASLRDAPQDEVFETLAAQTPQDEALRAHRAHTPSPRTLPKSLTIWPLFAHASRVAIAHVRLPNAHATGSAHEDIHQSRRIMGTRSNPHPAGVRRRPMRRQVLGIPGAERDHAVCLR